MNEKLKSLNIFPFLKNYRLMLTILNNINSIILKYSKLFYLKN